jgi:adenylosuccinate synthase
MPNVGVIGAQWGDEGKGKIVDLLSDRFDVVARYQGGHNAGHSVMIGSRRYALHLIPSGILREEKICVIGNGTVIDPTAFAKEVAELKAMGIRIGERLMLSDRAHVILPYHTAMEKAFEKLKGRDCIGSTLRGIGPAYEMKMARTGIRIADLLNPSVLGKKVEFALEEAGCLLKSLDDFTPFQPDRLVEDFLRYGEFLKPYIKDISQELNAMMDAGKSVLFEGAQGTMLDVDHGTYPYVTSSSSFAGGICTGLGVSPRRIDGLLGVMKAYCTRVGNGPFPTELKNELGDEIRERGHEYGVSTGRPRRCGWFDAAAARYSIRINRFDLMVLTLLDVLDEMEEIQICTGYRLGDEAVEQFPADIDRMFNMKPVFERVPGWKRPIGGCRRWEELPAETQRYVHRLEELVGVEIPIISVGAERNQTILRKNKTLENWLGA